MRAFGEAIKSIQGPLGNGKDFKLNGDVQIYILEGPSSFCINELDKSKPVRTLTNIQANDEGTSVPMEWRRNRFERDGGIRIHRA